MTGRILVTGAAGFVGSHLLDVLCGSDAEVIGWRRPVGPPPYSAPGVRWMDVELLDRDAVVAAIGDIRPAAIFHLAGSPHVAQSWQYTRETYEGNVLSTHNLFAAVRALDDKPRVLVACSAYVYAPQARPIREDDELKPGSPYATSKLATEMLSARAWSEDGVPAIIARSFNHTGPRQEVSFLAPSVARQIALIEAGRMDPVLTVGNLEPRRDLTDVRDTVRAYVAMVRAARPGIPYNVSSGRALAVGDLVRSFIAQARREIRIAQDPALFRKHDVPLLVGDNSRLASDTGWAPAIPIEQTIDDLLEYWRRRIATEA